MLDSSSPSPWQFAGKVVVVTGGSAGIGEGIAHAFARSGAHVVIAGRGFEALSRVAGQIKQATGGQVLAFRADVSQAADCAALIEAAGARFGAVDILVNNAAAFAVSPLVDLDPDDAARMLLTNVCGPLFCAQAMARWAIAAARPGVIVNISSVSGERQPAGYGLYAASKAALNSLTKTMAVEWTGQGLRVNGVAPGHVDTKAIQADVASGKLDGQAMLAGIPAHRLATVGDIAEATLFLSSDQSRHIVGHILSIDGGESLVRTWRD